MENVYGRLKLRAMHYKIKWGSIKGAYLSRSGDFIRSYLRSFADLIQPHAPTEFGTRLKIQLGALICKDDLVESCDTLKLSIYSEQSSVSKVLVTCFDEYLRLIQLKLKMRAQ